MENELENPSYFGVLPAKVRYDQTISASAKLLYVEISTLATAKGICWASNGYFARLYAVNKTTVSEWIHQLEVAGHIRTKKLEDGNRGISILTNIYGIKQDPSEKAEGGVRKKPKHNNTSINKSFVELQNSLLLLVNKTTGRTFRALPERGVKKTLDTFSLQEIEKALRALVADDWHSERIKEFKIDYLIRATTIDKFLSIGKDSAAEIDYSSMTNAEKDALMAAKPKPVAPTWEMPDAID